MGNPAYGKTLARILGMVGGTLGLVSVFLPWLSALRGLVTLNLIQMFNLPAAMRDQPVAQVAGYEVTGTIMLVAVLALVIVGSLFAFRTSRGGALLVLGSLLFAVGFSLYLPVGFLIELGLGFYLALVAGIVTLVGGPLEHILGSKRPVARAQATSPPVVIVQASSAPPPDSSRGVWVQPPPPPPPPY